MNLEHHSPRQFELTVTDLKQWVYCPRIPYYHHVMFATL
jgi:CRISPR/Cas system-associated exonuclease Cas4 (RecB family)